MSSVGPLTGPGLEPGTTPENEGVAAVVDTRWEMLGGLRFFLAWIVAATHLTAFLNSPSATLEWFAAFGAKAAVLGFLVVSGYSIAASLERDSRGFYRRRFLRVYPLYFFAIVFAVGLQMCVGDIQIGLFSYSPSDPLTCAGNFLLLQCFVVKPISFDGPVWSLSVEFFFYLLAPYLNRMRSRYIVALIVISGLIFLIPKPNNWGIFFFVLSKLAALRYFWAWLIGFLYFRHARASVMTLLLVSGAVLVGVNRAENRESLAVFTFVLSCLILVFAPLLRLPRFLRQPLTYLGDLSYPLYLYQLPCFIAAYALLGLRDPLVMIVVLGLVTVLSFEIIDVYLKKRYIKQLVNRGANWIAARLVYVPRMERLLRPYI
jgi:peptidoglycan/LPS O-acetylase OafA/YrhL